MARYERPEDLGPYSMKEMENPAFLEYIRQQCGMPVPPDKEDYDLTVFPRTEEEAGHQYRLAQSRKLLRMYREWKATQN
jgi:hypothetical protein